MPEPFYEQYDTNRGQEALTRLRFESKETLSYQLIESDLRDWPGFPFHSLAHKFYDDETLWWIIHDSNPIRQASRWTTGDIVEVPIDYRDALVLSQNQSIVQRKIY